MRCEEEEEEEAERLLAFSKRPDVGCRLARANHAPAPPLCSALHQRPPPRRASVDRGTFASISTTHARRTLRRHSITNVMLLLRARSLYRASTIALLHLWRPLVHCDTVPVSSHSPACIPPNILCARLIQF